MDNTRDRDSLIADLVIVIKTAISSGDWTVNGANDPSTLLLVAEQVVGEEVMHQHE